MNKSIEQVIAEVNQLLAGLPDYCTSITFTFDGTTYTCSEFEAVCQRMVDANTAVRQARGALDEAVTKQRAAFVTILPIIAHGRTVIAGALANEPAILAVLGVTPRKKPARLTVDALLTKAEKAKATRKARGTKSKKQKAKIFGDVTGVAITPVVEGAPK